jgi:hypothetical protein
MPLIDDEIHKLDLLYGIAEVYAQNFVGPFNLRMLTELIVTLSANVSQFRDEQKTEAIVSVIRRLYKSNRIQEKLSVFPESKQRRLTRFIDEALPYYVDMADEFVPSVNLLDRIKHYWNSLMLLLGFTKKPVVNHQDQDQDQDRKSVSEPVIPVQMLAVDETKTDAFRDTKRETVAAADLDLEFVQAAPPIISYSVVSQVSETKQTEPELR